MTSISSTPDLPARRAGPAPVAAPFVGSDRLLLGMCLGVSTYWLFGGAMTAVVAVISEDLGLSPSRVSAAVSTMALVSGVLIVAAGGLADRIGRVRVAQLGLVASVVGSVLCALADGQTLLVVGRAFQGLSGALVMPSTLALVKAYYDGNARTRALSFWSMAAWGGSGLCSLFGGTVAAVADWEWIFWLTVPAALASLVLVSGTPESRASNVAPGFDFVGLALMVLGLTTLNLTVNNAAHWGWGSGRALGGFLLSALLLVGFVLFEQRQSNPLLALSLFKRGAFDGAVASDFLLNFCGVGSIYVLLLYVQNGRDLSSFHAGLLTLSTTVTTLVSIRLGEHLGRRRGPRLPMFAGSVVGALGVLLMTFTSVDGGAYYALVVVGFAITGLGLGATATPSTDIAVGQAPHDLAGAASGVYKMASSLGAAFGIAITNAVVTSLTDNHTSSLDRGASFGLTAAVIAAGLSAVVVWVAISPRLPEDAPAPGDDTRRDVGYGVGRAGGAG